MLESLLEPIETQEDNTGVNANWIRHHTEEVNHQLLKSIEQVGIKSIQSCLGVCTASKEESINICQLTSSRCINQDGSNNSQSNNPEI